MSLDYINEAFRSLELLTEDVFKADSEGINELSDFMSSDVDDEDKISIIDMDAETEEDLQGSYVGKVIVDCNVCHSHIFKDREDIQIDDDKVSILQNGRECECPMCGEDNGFVIVGEIHEFNPNAKTEEEVTEELDNEADELEEVNESLITEDLEDDEAVRSGFMKVLSTRNSDGERFLRQASELKRYTFITDNSKPSFIDYDNKVVHYNEDESTEEAATKIAKDMINHGIKENLEEALTEESNMSKLRSMYPELNETLENDIEEDFRNVSIETDDQKMVMTSEKDGKVAVTTEPIESTDLEGEVISDVSPETEEEIIDANTEEVPEEEVTEEPAEEEAPVEAVEEEIEEVDEESMNNLGESYLKSVYENVDSFKLTSCSTTPTQLVLEGLIKFKSGITKNTGFIFEAKDATRDGKLRFVGENAHLCRGRKAFTLVGSLNESKKLICESLTYNYRAKNGEGKSTRVYGKVNNK